MSDRDRPVIWGFGYFGYAPEALARWLEEHAAVVYDVRSSATSWLPVWGGDRLARLLGARYRHVPAWGNVHWRKTDRHLGIDIADFPAGLAVLERETAPEVVLMCACPHPATCHRLTLAGLLSDRGYRILGEVVIDPPRRQRTRRQAEPTLPGLKRGV